MFDAPRATPRLSAASEMDVPEYRSISTSAVLGCLFGLGAATALLAPGFWVVPVAGVVCSLFALRRIATSDREMIGRNAAMTGLLLSVVFAVAAPMDWLFYRWMLQSQARQFAACWFEYLHDRDPTKAFELTLEPERRGTLWTTRCRGTLRRARESDPSWRSTWVPIWSIRCSTWATGPASDIGTPIGRRPQQRASTSPRCTR